MYFMGIVGEMQCANETDVPADLNKMSCFVGDAFPS